jgi:predicted dehydrogenase
MMTPEGITHDAVPYFMERFENAYLAQIQNFVEHVQKGLQPSITGADAMAALRISVAANLSMREGRVVDIQELAAAPDQS